MRGIKNFFRYFRQIDRETLFNIADDPILSLIRGGVIDSSRCYCYHQHS